MKKSRKAGVILLSGLLVLATFKPQSFNVYAEETAESPNYFLTNKEYTPVEGFGGNGADDPDVFVSMYVGNGTSSSNAEQYNNTLIWPHNNAASAAQFSDLTKNDFVSDSMWNRLHGVSMTKDAKVVIPVRYNQVREDIMLSARTKEILTNGSLNSVPKPYLTFSLTDDNGAVVFNGSNKLNIDNNSTILNESWDSHQFFDGKIALHETQYVQTDDSQWNWATGTYKGEWQKRLHQWNADTTWDSNAQYLIDNYGVSTSNISPSLPVSQVKYGSSASGFKNRFGFKWFNPHTGTNTAGNLTMATEWHAAFNVDANNATDIGVGSYDGYGPKELGVIGMFNGIMDAGLSNLGGFPTVFGGGMGAQLAMRGFYRNGADAADTPANSYAFDNASYGITDAERKSDSVYNIHVNADIANSADKMISLTKAPIYFTLAVTRPYFQNGDADTVEYITGSSNSFDHTVKVGLYDDGVLKAADSDGNVQNIAVNNDRVKIYASTEEAPDWAAVIDLGLPYTYSSLKTYLDSLEVGDEVKLLYTYMGTDAKTDTWTPGLSDDEGAYAIPLVQNVKITRAPDPTSITLKATKTTTGKALTDGQFEFAVFEGGSEVATGTNTANGTITFSTISYKEAGEHTYIIRETSISGGGWTVDSTVYTVKVTVVSSTGRLTATAAYPDGGVEFHNTYQGTLTEPKPTEPSDVAKEKSPDNLKTVPPTGDYSNIGVWIVIIIASLAVLAGIVVIKRKKK